MNTGNRNSGCFDSRPAPAAARNPRRRGLPAPRARGIIRVSQPPAEPPSPAAADGPGLRPAEGDGD